MSKKEKKPLVQTKPEMCKVCYSCVRECPARAIRITGGQAEVIVERCIGCGNCVRVCTQQAKKTRNCRKEVKELLKSPAKVAAMLAPSFPAEFTDIPYKNLISMLRELGFDYVTEVAFGADMVSRAYKKMMSNNDGSQYIATTCPAVVSFVEKYHPAIVQNLSPIVSPMVANARALHKIYGKDLKIVFIGPCLAKKEEAQRKDTTGDVDEVLTFIELRELFSESNIEMNKNKKSDFDPPHPGKGTLYPIGRGMLQASNLEEDLMTMKVIATEGPKELVQALKEFEIIEHEVELLELLCCNGCIMGSGMSNKLSKYGRRGYISSYAKKKFDKLDMEEWQKNMKECKDIDLTAEFEANDTRLPKPTHEELDMIMQKMGKYTQEDELNCGACGYETCIQHAIAIFRGLAESEMCLPYTIKILETTANELSSSYKQLIDTQHAMVNSEKLASLGRLASGIAHEINNPLTGVLTYSSILLEELKNSKHKEDLDIIVKETTRCREIVRGLLNFARETKVEKTYVNINDIIKDTMKIVEKHIDFQNLNIIKKLDEDLPELYLDINHMKSVINNLTENAAHAMNGNGDLTIITMHNKIDNTVIMQVKDNGCGISKENLLKIFDPFHTTKKPGTGTGLGLAVVYGIVKQHQGTVSVDSTINSGTTFTVTLPVIL